MRRVGISSEGANERSAIRRTDRYRALAIKDGNAAHLLSRRNNLLNEDYPEIAAALDAIEDGSIVDGEIVAFDPEGRPSFNLLQRRKQSSAVIVYYVFDLVAYRGRDLRTLPLYKRQEVLNEVIRPASDSLRISQVLAAEPAQLIQAVRSQGLEGIVAKRKNSR